MKAFFSIFTLAACAAVFLCGITGLFEWRFERGDVYPPYSSLRADPLGTMAFHDSLQKVQGVSVRRDFSGSDRLPEEPHTAYLHLGGSPDELEWLPPDSFREIRSFVLGGSRLVITFFPQTNPEFFDEDQEATNSAKSASFKKTKKTPANHAKKTKEPVDEDTWVSLEDEWDFHIGFQRLERDGNTYAPASVVNWSGLPLSKTLDWHSGIVFTNCDDSWRTIYARGTNGVVMERNFGKGSVVLATDSYFLSNEAMANDRHSDLLAWLLGANTNIVFDEAHFGIIETAGVATLMRQYRLHGLVAGLVLLAGLFIWKNSTSLAPPPAEEKNAGFVAGKDSAAGFVNLLRRSIAPRDLLAACFAEWKKSAASGMKIPAARLDEAERIFAAGDAAPYQAGRALETYGKICEIPGIRIGNL